METDISVDDAMKLVFSGGFVLPDNLAIARVPRMATDVNEDFLGAFKADSSVRDGENQQQDSAANGGSGAPAVGGLMPKEPEAGRSS